MDILVIGFPRIRFDVFDVRGDNEVPGLDYDLYISSGGPGDPLEGDGAWDVAYYDWLDTIWSFNQTNANKKYVFFICHSFQMACNYFHIAEINKRPEKSFGIFPVSKTTAGRQDQLFQYLPDPFYAGDFREFQVINPDFDKIRVLNMEVLGMESEHSHTFKHLAVMAIRFSDTVYGTQFHPESFPEGMLRYFKEEDRRQLIHEEYGVKIYEEMLFHLRDPMKIQLTHEKLLPEFIALACASIDSTVSTLDS
jgi:homoserine O-succinyltransferase